MQSLDGKGLFELPLTEVADVQGGKEDVIMEFHVDDGTISMTEDALCSVTFVIPEGNPDFQGRLLMRLQLWSLPSPQKCCCVHHLPCPSRGIHNALPCCSNLMLCLTACAR